MKRSLLLLLWLVVLMTMMTAVYGVRTDNGEYDDDARWAAFKAAYGKRYVTRSEEAHRRAVFRRNAAFVDAHRVAINEYADLTFDEFATRKMGLLAAPPSSSSSSSASARATLEARGLPASVDWREKGVVTGVKNQLDCGSCWAFSAAGAIEGQQALASGRLVDMSEENLIDCSWAQGDMGCGGGLPSYAFEYVIANKGIDTEARYPLASVWISDCTVPTLCPCTYNRSVGAVGAVVTSYTSLPAGSEASLEHALATVGPVSVCIDAEQALQFYARGVFSSRSCSSDRANLNHAVLAVGYGSALVNGTEMGYYIVKNSWGRSWGMEGYVLFERGSNMCGITTLATYPTVIY